MMKRIAGGALIFLGLLVVWYWPLVRSIIQPTLIGSVNPVPAATLPPQTFRYPALGISAPLSEDAATSPLKSQDWQTIALSLRNGVSLSYDGASLADAPLAFITGHSSDTVHHPYEAVFAGLGQAEQGDQFSFTTASDFWEYEVVDVQLIAPTDMHAFEALSPTDGSHRVALVTCWPPLTTRDRKVVVGILTDHGTINIQPGGES